MSPKIFEELKALATSLGPVNVVLSRDIQPLELVFAKPKDSDARRVVGISVLKARPPSNNCVFLAPDPFRPSVSIINPDGEST